LLVRVAKRLRAVAGPAALVARLGGDEFAIVTAHAPLQPPRELAGQVIDEIGKPFELGTAVSIRVGVSVGIAIVPAEGSEIDSVLRAADEAMYVAKRQGRAQRALTPDSASVAGSGANVSFASGR